MIKYIFLISLVFSLNLFAEEKDSLILEKRIKNAVEWIKKDSLFNAYMVANCSKELTFILDDSTTYPIFFSRIVSGLFSDSTSKFKGKIWNLSKYCENNWKGSIFISHKLNDENSKYHLILMEYEFIPFMLGFYVLPNDKCINSKGIIIFLLYDKNNNIYHSYSIINDWSN